MKKYSHKTTFDSFRVAVRGLVIGFKSQRNFRTGIIIGLIVFITGLLLKFSSAELALAMLSIGFVLFAELTNTVIEFVVDTYFRTRCSQIAKMSKDLAAGAVLLAIIITGIIGAILFLPKIIKLFII